MALASLFTSVAVPYLPSPRNEGNILARFRPTHLVLPRHRLSLGLSTVACARRRSTESAASKKKKKQQSSRKNRDEEDEDFDDDDDEMDEDAFEALFKELEKDLKNDASSMDDDDDDDFDDLSEEDFLKVERALADALLGGSDDDDDDIELTASSVDSIGSDNDAETDDRDEEEDDDEEEEEEEEEDEEDDDDDDDDDDEEELKLKNWQLRRLASALKVGRRKTSIKLLAAELCLDRAVVLKLLRDPPPKLLMYSATLPDFEPTTPVITSVPETEPVETVPDVEPRTKVPVPVPVHAMQSRWSAQKGIKKVQALTLEQVYRKSKRPTNAMISSIVLVTKLPRKRVLKWFEDKRAEDGVPDKYPAPYQRSDPKTTR